MIFRHPITFKNYRSIVSDLHIPFTRKMTLVVGQNNSGKSNVLRFLGILFNQAFDRIEPIEDFPNSNHSIEIAVELDEIFLKSALQGYKNALEHIEKSRHKSLSLRLRASRNGLSAVATETNLDEVFPNYFNGRNFLSDFGQSGSKDRDLFLDRLNIKSLLGGTTYLPNIRFITIHGQEPPQFVNWKMPGNNVAFGEIVKRLSEMDRPDPDKRHLRAYKSKICDFIAYCLEAKNVSIEIPDSKKTILISINGDERPIASFGTGVEQLVMIGLASMGFEDRLVLIDEPELHLHPRAQKRIINYLMDSTQSQYVIATHSAAILDAVEADVIHLSYNDNSTLSRTISSNSEKYKAVRDLGHSPSELLQTRFAIWVEGPSDRIYIKYWISMINPELMEGVDFTVVF